MTHTSFASIGRQPGRRRFGRRRRTARPGLRFLVAEQDHRVADSVPRADPRHGPRPRRGRDPATAEHRDAELFGSVAPLPGRLGTASSGSAARDTGAGAPFRGTGRAVARRTLGELVRAARGRSCTTARPSGGAGRPSTASAAQATNSAWARRTPAGRQLAGTLGAASTRAGFTPPGRPPGRIVPSASWPKPLTRRGPGQPVATSSLR